MCLGNVPRDVDPSKFRSPADYNALLRSVSLAGADGKTSWGFETVRIKTLASYIEVCIRTLASYIEVCIRTLISYIEVRIRTLASYI